MKVANNNLKNR